MAKPIYRTAAWQKVRTEVLNRDGHQCQIHRPGCTGRATTVDHIIAHANDGAWYDPTNLQAACPHCNSGKANSEERNHRNLSVRAW